MPLKMICESSAKSRRTAMDPATKALTETYIYEAEFQAAPDSEENRAFFPTQQGAFLRLQNYLHRFRFGDLCVVEMLPAKEAPAPAAGATRLRFVCQHGKIRRLTQTAPDGQKINAVVCDAEFVLVANAEENRPTFSSPSNAFLKLVACGAEFEAQDEYFVDISPAPAEAKPATMEAPATAAK